MRTTNFAVALFAALPLLGCHAKRVLPKASPHVCSRSYPSGSVVAADGTATREEKPVASVEDCEIPNFFAPDPPNWGTMGWLTSQFLEAPVHGTNFGNNQYWSYLAVYFVVPPNPPVAPADSTQDIGFFPGLETAAGAFNPRILQPVLYYGTHAGTLGWWVSAIYNLSDTDPSKPQQATTPVQVFPGDGLVGLISLFAKWPDIQGGKFVFNVSIQRFTGFDSPGSPAITQAQYTVTDWIPRTFSPMALEAQTVPLATCGLLPGSNTMPYVILGMGIPTLPPNTATDFTDGSNPTMVAGLWANDGSYTSAGTKTTGGCSANSVYLANPAAPWNGSLTWNTAGTP
jgi:hypothetical protein